MGFPPSIPSLFNRGKALKTKKSIAGCLVFDRSRRAADQATEKWQWEDIVPGCHIVRFEGQTSLYYSWKDSKVLTHSLLGVFTDK